MRKLVKLFARKSSSKPAGKVLVRHPRRAVIIASEVMMVILIALTAIPVVGNTLQSHWQEQAYIQKMDDSARESAFRQQHLCMQISLYWEMKHKRSMDAVGIAGNIMTRVDSPKYPNSVCEVVNEIRQKNKVDVAMYSYIFDGRYIPKYNDTAWITAGVIAENVMKAHDEGRPFIHSVNYLTPEAFGKTKWAAGWKDYCEIKPITIEGAYHIFFDTMTPEERRTCMAELDQRQDQTIRAIIAANKVKLPVEGPVITFRPRPAI